MKNENEKENNRLTEDMLNKVSGGSQIIRCAYCGSFVKISNYENHIQNNCNPGQKKFELTIED